jgi:hypothetical protein
VTDSSITFGSVLGVMIVKEEEKDKDVFHLWLFMSGVRGGAVG